jgi:hypothetical protein
VEELEDRLHARVQGVDGCRMPRRLWCAGRMLWRRRGNGLSRLPEQFVFRGRLLHCLEANLSGGLRGVALVSVNAPK